MSIKLTAETGRGTVDGAVAKAADMVRYIAGIQQDT